ncbi:hypothetical protein [Lysobacter firmicutimachus]|uniref:Uncharacterized protein n=1 Tax=Lysobacter firmicutimachus TaxID=1792846 RepID=A0ABU8CYM9_9GAMM
MREWLFLLALTAAPAWAQTQCEAYEQAMSGVEIQFIPHLAAPPNAYSGISYSGDKLLQVQAVDLSGRKAKAMKKNGEACDCWKLLVDNCKTVYIPAKNGVFTVFDAYQRGLVFVPPAKR